MNLKKTSFLIFICFFPVFVFRSNLNLFEIINTILIFTLPILIINYFIISKKLFNSKFFNLYISFIIVFGIDNNLGLWNGFIQPFKNDLFKIFDIIYYPGFFLLLLLILIFFILISFADKKFVNVIIVFLITIFTFNLFDQTKSYKKIKDFTKTNTSNYKKTDLVIVFDEMSGLNSLSSQTNDGKKFDIIAKKFFQDYNFEFYSNISSISGNSVSSLSALLNLSNSESIREKVASSSENYFYEYELSQNLFFKKFKDISVYQNIHIDYCTFNNIKKCKTYNPFNQKKYLMGFKDNYLSKIISLWKINGSIFSALIWRSLREIRLIDSNLEPEGHKASFNSFFENLEKDIYSKKYDLIFAHSLVPHRPYGFNKNCHYDGDLSLRNTLFSKKKHIDQHNIERKCVFNFLNKFLKNLKKNNHLNNINLTILSDHGSRIGKNKSSYLSVIYGHRNENTKFYEYKNEVLSQNIFLKKYN